ncbi:unnamed protein product [Boreogadus saida]
MSSARLESGAQEPTSIFMCLLCFVSMREKQDKAIRGVRGASVVEMVVQQEPRPSRLRRNQPHYCVQGGKYYKS